MLFFVPNTKTETEAEKIYGILRKSIIKQGYPLGDARIYEIEFEDNGQQLTETVGKPSAFGAETVIAIFDSEETYLICTTSRGVLSGTPMRMGKWATLRVELFDSNAEG